MSSGQPTQMFYAPHTIPGVEEFIRETRLTHDLYQEACLYTDRTPPRDPKDRLRERALERELVRFYGS